MTAVFKVNLRHEHGGFSMTASRREVIDEVIELNHVKKAYKKKTLFTDLNLGVERGESCAVLGENGSGKSTLLKMICGLVRPDGGEIFVEGVQRFARPAGVGGVGKLRFAKRNSCTMGRFLRDMGAVLDGAGFLPGETGLKNLAILAEIRGKAAREDLEEAMRLVGLDPALKAEVGKYPPELKQRLALAQALMEKPSLLILDEPFQNIGRDRGERLRQLLERLNGEGVTILMTARRPEDTWGLCGSVYEIVSGGLRKVGEREREWQALIDGAKGVF